MFGHKSRLLAWLTFLPWLLGFLSFASTPREQVKEKPLEIVFFVDASKSFKQYYGEMTEKSLKSVASYFDSEDDYRYVIGVYPFGKKVTRKMITMPNKLELSGERATNFIELFERLSSMPSEQTLYFIISDFIHEKFDCGACGKKRDICIENDFNEFETIFKKIDHGKKRVNFVAFDPTQCKNNDLKSFSVYNAAQALNRETWELEDEFDLESYIIKEVEIFKDSLHQVFIDRVVYTKDSYSNSYGVVIEFDMPYTYDQEIFETISFGGSTDNIKSYQYMNHIMFSKKGDLVYSDLANNISLSRKGKSSLDVTVKNSVDNSGLEIKKAEAVYVPGLDKHFLCSLEFSQKGQKIEE